MKLLKNEEYHPSFNVDETHKCFEIFQSGFSILNKYLNYYLNKQLSEYSDDAHHGSNNPYDIEQGELERNVGLSLEKGGRLKI